MLSQAMVALIAFLEPTNMGEVGQSFCEDGMLKNVRVCLILEGQQAHLTRLMPERLKRHRGAFEECSAAASHTFML